MKRKVALLLLIILVLATTWPAVRGEQAARYRYVSSYSFENRGDGPLNLTEDDMTIPLFVNDQWQSVTIGGATAGVVREHLDVDGNRLAVINLTVVPPHAVINFSITYDVEASDRPRPSIDLGKAGSLSDIPPELVDEFGVESETFTMGSPEIRALALALSANESTVLGKVTSIMDWMVDNVSYGNFELPQYPNETKAQGMGDCDDQAILLVTMCRALGIPSILQVGVLFNSGIEGEKTSWSGHLYTSQKGIGWHGWAMVYVPPWGWIPIDMTLVKSPDALSMIRQAPEYGRDIVVAFNVSRQAYVGDSRRAMERLISSDLYVSSSDVGTSVVQGNDASMEMYALGVTVVAAMVIAIVVLARRGKNG